MIDGSWKGHDAERTITMINLGGNGLYTQMESAEELNS